MFIYLTSVNEFITDTDAETLDRCILDIASGNISALETLYTHTKASVYGFALSILKNTHDAEDVLHDCYIHIYQSACGYEPQRRPMAWILTITRNLCLLKLRERKRTSSIPEEDWEKYLDSRDEISVEDKQLLRDCMEQLSDEERQIIIIHAVAGFKHREIASMLQKPLSTVLSKYSRGIKKLKQSYERSIGNE